MTENADWYVPSLNSSKEELPEGLFITMFDSRNHVSEGLSSSDVKKEYERNSKAVGEYILSLSPERLALHETIIAISTQLKVASEDDFVDTFNKIYEEAVLPLIQSKNSVFETKNKLIKKNVETYGIEYFGNSQEKALSKYKSDFEKYTDQYNKNLAKNKNEIQTLAQKFSVERPTRDERQKMQELQEITSFMEQNKERIIIDIVINSQILQSNRKLVKDFVSGDKGLFNSEYIKQFNHLTLHSKESRKSFLIVGGAASGKGGVTNSVKNAQEDPQDLLEINPDLYKKLLLPFSEVKGHEELHAALTHMESAIVFDNIAETWQKMAENDQAPNILMDVQRAGNWQLGVLGTGDTNIYASSPVLPLTIALDRAYSRGLKTGRFVPTEEIIRGHKEQLKLNLNAMKKGVSYQFYNTNISFGEIPPLIAEYNPAKSEMNIYDMHSMYDYFQKDELNVNARNLDTLSKATPKSTVAAILMHSEFMDINIKSADKVIANIKQDENASLFEVTDWNALQQAMGENDAKALVQGLVENDVEIKGSKDIEAVVEEIKKQLYQESSGKDESVSQIKNMVCEEYANLLESLVEEGQRVGKTESIYVYDFATDEELKDKNITIHTQNLDVLSEEAKLASSNNYDPSRPAKKQMLLVIDPKVYNSEKKRGDLIKRVRMQVKATGVYRGEGVYMNERGKLNDDYLIGERSACGVVQSKPNPEAVRVAFKIKDKACRIPVQWDAGGYSIEQDGSVVIREKDMVALETALASYRKDKDPAHLLTEDGKAKIDIYGTDPFFIEDNYSHIFSETKFRDAANQLLSEGVKIKSKNATSFDDIIAVQLKNKESLTMPDGTTLKPGDWIAIPENKSQNLQKELDLGISLPTVSYIDKETMKKSYLPNQKHSINSLERE